MMDRSFPFFLWRYIRSRQFLLEVWRNQWSIEALATHQIWPQKQECKNFQSTTTNFEAPKTPPTDTKFHNRTKKKIENKQKEKKEKIKTRLEPKFIQASCNLHPEFAETTNRLQLKASEPLKDDQILTSIKIPQPQGRGHTFYLPKL